MTGDESLQELRAALKPFALDAIRSRPEIAHDWLCTIVTLDPVGLAMTYRADADGKPIARYFANGTPELAHAAAFFVVAASERMPERMRTQVLAILHAGAAQLAILVTEQAAAVCLVPEGDEPPCELARVQLLPTVH